MYESTTTIDGPIAPVRPAKTKWRNRLSMFALWTVRDIEIKSPPGSE